eukprot:scaffold9811_cov147-Skeletonema_marinoi.AAC.6
MAEAQEADVIFIYTGGDQVVPNDVVRVRIDKSVTIIPREAFFNRRHLIYVEFHDGIEIIEKHAFHSCYSLKGSIKLLGVKVIKARVFANCGGLTDVEFGVELETIGESAFYNCTSLTRIRMPSVKTIGRWAFSKCMQLTDLEFGEALVTIQEHAFNCCIALGRIAVPLKSEMIEDDVFGDCPNLTTMDLVGGIHRTVASLHLERWRNDTKQEINRINQVLPDTEEKTAALQQWMRSVISQLDHYKAEHKALLKEATTLLELALWKANLDDNEGGVIEQEGVRTTRGRRKRARKEICVTSGASIVIKNVLPFLTLLE